MVPGIGERFKKIAKVVSDAERKLQEAEATLEGRRAPVRPSAPPPSAATRGAPVPQAASNAGKATCRYCGGLVPQNTPKCPSCNAPTM